MSARVLDGLITSYRPPSTDAGNTGKLRPDYIATDMDYIGPTRERALANFAAERFLSLTTKVWREGEREQMDPNTWIGYKWFGNYDFQWEAREGEGGRGTIPSPIPRNFSPRSLHQDFQSRLHHFDVSNPGLVRSLLQQRTLFSTMLRPVMNQKWTGDVSLDARRRYRPKTSPANLRSHTW